MYPPRPEAVGLRAPLGQDDRYVGKILHINAGHALSCVPQRQGRDREVHSGKLLYEIEIERRPDAAGDEPGDVVTSAPDPAPN